MSLARDSLVSQAPDAPGALDLRAVRAQFSILNVCVHGKPLVYLDNAATSQSPRAVIEAVTRFYSEYRSNVHRGVHVLSERATHEYEAARDTVRSFLNAAHREEIVFTRGTTEAVNLVAQSFGRTYVSPGDEVVISALEHHSNIVPWQMLCAERSARLRVLPMDDEGNLLLDALDGLLHKRTKLLAVGYVSNALGTVNPVREMISRAHASGIPVLLDAAQAAPHLPLDVQALDCDFLAFSSHKTYGPTGVGVLYAKRALLETLPPYQGGGDMIRSVTFEKTTYNELPHRFEAGTPNIGGAIGLAAALRFLESLGWEAVQAHEADLLRYAEERLDALPGLRRLSRARHRAAIVSFVMEGVHAHDVGSIVDREGVAIRTGHHCAQPVMDRLRVPATARASFGIYNTRAEVDTLAAALGRVGEIFG
jgi:cysteine desulfurase/selenocysteine lyase